MTKTEKTFSTRSNTKRAIASFRDKNPDLSMIGVSVVSVGDKFAVHATDWEKEHVAAIDAAGFTRVEDDAAAAPDAMPNEDEASNAKAERKAKANAPTKGAKPASPKAKGNGPRKAAQPANGERGPTKTELGLGMLRAKKGVTVAEMGEEFGWLPHTTRAWISATAGKKLGNAIETEVVEGRGRVYRIAG